MNDEEWILEYYGMHVENPPDWKDEYYNVWIAKLGFAEKTGGSWIKSCLYKYDKVLGLVLIHRGTNNPEWWDACHSIDKTKDQYRLRHIPTGKIIPGDLL